MRSASSRRLRRRRKPRDLRKVCCALCGVVKYTPPVRRKLARRRVPKVSSVCLKEQDDQLSAKSEYKHGKLVIWLSRYPKVNLCDIGRVFEVSHHFSCYLPPALFPVRQRSGVHCFKRQILALMCQELLEDGNVRTSSFCQSEHGPLSSSTCGTGSSFPAAVEAEPTTKWQAKKSNNNKRQDDISRKRKRQIADELFNVTTDDKDNLFVPSEVNTCQRTQVFVRRNRYLCSRTYITWPFHRNDPPPFVMSPRWSSAGDASESLGKLHVSCSQESRQNGEVPESMTKREVGSEQVVFPSLKEESEVVPSATRGKPLTCKPLIFHQTYHDVALSGSASGSEVSESAHTLWLKRIPNKPIPTELETLSSAPGHGQGPPHGQSWRSGGRAAFDTQSTTSSEDDLSTEKCQRDKDSEDDEEVDDVDEDIFDSGEVMCERPDPLCSPSHSPSAGASDNTTNDLQVHEQDAIVLDVIDDDPDLYGSMTERRDKPVQTRTIENSSKPANCTKKTILSDTERCLKEPTDKAEVKKTNLQCGEKALDCTPNNQMTRRVPFLPSSSWTQENGTDGDGNGKDWNSGWNTGRNLPSNPKQNTCNTDNFTLLKNGGPSRPAFYDTYCKYYFSENHPCLRKNCSFLHVPRSGDEKFCMVTVQRFTQSNNPVHVKRAVDLFAGYYEMCSPGVCFNVQVVTGLLAALLRLSFLSETLHVLNLLLKHNIRPPSDCVLAVFEHACDRMLHNTVPQLVFMISKVVEAGCVFSLDQCERLQKCLVFLNAPKTQMDLFVAVKCRALANICENPSEVVNIAHAFIDLELYKKQEDWRQMAAVFLHMCASPCTPSHLLKICVCVASALLGEPSQSHTLPYSCFAEAVSSQVSDEGVARTFLGRIGISMLNHYYKKQQWSKGQKIVEILSEQQSCYSVMKGVFGGEEDTSRCCLITMATELHLHTGSVEGALNVLRDNNWFVSCSRWPCERADVAHRVSVQTRLAQCTSHRDALELLTHLPGLQPPVDSAEVREYTGLFNSLLRSCLKRHALLVAADTLEVMLGSGLPAELVLVQSLICDLGKRNHWNRARVLFQRAHEQGYYPLVEVVLGSLVLELPSSLNEVEMAVCLEMFISRNMPDSTQTPDISQAPVVLLKRASENGAVLESEYLSAGCRLLSSAQLPNPKLRLSYTVANPKQEQVYTIEPGSAHNWLLCNHSWAHKLWSV
ncbi:protein TOPAZ1 isoform X2 [Clupea harengus]|uniref:Protein TOPAZ1 n=1 Tax=Clupea harengus TaxID=7950 RepID=A0A6P8H552_CLUHA|nr:protein TOPAZ1 isoform X2 [Clupea harengus]